MVMGGGSSSSLSCNTSQDTGVFFLIPFIFYYTNIFLSPQYVETAVEMAMVATAVTVLGAQDTTCLDLW